VIQVLDKPAHPPVANTWGAAIWSDAFADLLHEGIAGLSADGPEPAIGHFFDLAVQRGLKVIGLPIADGSFEDAGTRVGILRCLDAQQTPVLVPARSSGDLGSHR
jgi:glucose-1-phosphate thymidylyltransferase